MGFRVKRKMKEKKKKRSRILFAVFFISVTKKAQDHAWAFSISAYCLGWCAIMFGRDPCGDFVNEIEYSAPWQ